MTGSFVPWVLSIRIQYQSARYWVSTPHFAAWLAGFCARCALGSARQSIHPHEIIQNKQIAFHNSCARPILALIKPGFVHGHPRPCTQHMLLFIVYANQPGNNIKRHSIKQRQIRPGHKRRDQIMRTHAPFAYKHINPRRWDGVVFHVLLIVVWGHCQGWCTFDSFARETINN